MGAVAGAFPGGGDVEDPELRRWFEAAWLPRWGERAATANGFIPVRQLPTGRGLQGDALVAAIETGRVKALYIENPIGGRFAELDPALMAALPKLEYLVVADHYEDTPLGRLAHALLPLAMSMEKDGTFTSFDRTVQRLRAAVPSMGEAKGGTEIVSLLARRMGYGLEERHPANVMAEIARVVPGYAGISYARLERNGINVPTRSFADAGTPVIGVDGGEPTSISPSLIPAPAAG